MTPDDIAAFLKQNSIDGEFMTLDVPTPTVAAAAQAVGVSPEQIVKSVVILADLAPILMIANGMTRIDTKRLSDYLGIARKRIKLADAATVLELTGFPVGGVPPFGHKTHLRTLIAQDVLTQAEVYTGGGSEQTLVRITPAELLRVTAAEVLSPADKL
jgi:prolyl-tRNA editing enzyme YbaK/EbsC (Cys-tRNA(Pro) deacylase)